MFFLRGFIKNRQQYLSDCFETMAILRWLYSVFKRYNTNKMNLDEEEGIMMKKQLSLLLAAILLIMQIPAAFAENKDSENTMLKNVALYDGDFSSEQQVSKEPSAKDIPILSGGSEYDGLHGAEIYREDFTSGDLSKWKGLTTAFSIKENGIDGNYLSLAPGGNDRGTYTFFKLPAQAVEEYVYECDVRLKAGSTKSSQVTLMAEDYTFGSGNENYGVESGYIMKLNTVASNTWTVNPDTDNQTVTVPEMDWVHIKVSAKDGVTGLEITNGRDVLYHGEITPSSSKAVPYGFYMRGGKSNAVMDVDNLVMKMTLDDSFCDYITFKDRKYVGATILPEAEKLVYAALYNAEGQLLSLKLVVCEGKAQTVKFDRPEESGCTVRLYNWMDGMQPLCSPSKEIAVDQIIEKRPDTTDSFLYGSFTAEKSADGTMVYEHGMPYRYYLPQNYDSTKSYPVVMYLHGSGRRGTDNKEQLVNAKYMFNTLLNEPYINDPNTQCIMIAPQCPADEKWVDRGWADGSYRYESVPVSDELSMAHDIVLRFMKQYSVNRDKVYIAGQSMGGYGCWRMALEYPELFAAAVPLCGAGATDEKGAGRMAKENIAVWAFHGDADTTVPVSGSREMVSAVRRYGAQNINYTEMAGWGHEIQEEVFTGIGKANGLYEWLFDQSRAKNADHSALPRNINETVDLALFAGQSNMSGRGEAAKAVMCDVDAGFEYKAISNPNILVPVTEPFGLNEDKAGEIADYDSTGKTKRSGSMVSAVVDEYYKQTGRQLVAVSASIGGTSTAQWKEKYIGDAVGRLDAAKGFLTANGIRIGRIFVVWCQGETDGDNNVSAQTYTENTKELLRRMQEHGAQQCFMVQTGHYNYVDYPNGNNGIDGAAFDQRYGVIRTAQEELCANEETFVMAGSLEPYISSMKDQYHYWQSAYNEVGKTVGKTIAGFYE